MSTDYWLGVATLPALLLTLWLLGLLLRTLLRLGGRLGFSVQMQLRPLEGVSDYVLRNNIFWERSFGPVFVGGWYREDPIYPDQAHRRFNRWIGLGHRDGVSVAIFRRYDLGRTPADTDG